MEYVITLIGKQSSVNKRYLEVAYDNYSDMSNWTDDEDMAFVFDSSDEAAEVRNEAGNILDEFVVKVEAKKTYDVVFNNGEQKTNKGWEAKFCDCKAYIEDCNGTQDESFAANKGGVVFIVCNQTKEEVFHEDVL